MKPLGDIRIVSLEQYGAGPFGSMHLADLGAEVIKIEDPKVGGDIGRYVPPFTDGQDSLFFQSFNRNKRSIALDMNTPAGREVFEDLVRCGDAVFSNLRGDVPAKMRIRYADVQHLNPAVVCVSLSGFGMSGPRQLEPGYDYVLQALAGWMDITGEPHGPPTKAGLSLVDYCGGFVAANSLLVGLHAARRDGIGGDCDVSLYDTAVSLLTYLGVWHMNGGFEPIRTRHSAHPSLVPFQAFETADGWLVVGCAKEKFWVRLVEVLGREELAIDERFATFADRREHADVLLPILEEAFLKRTTSEWVAVLQEARVPSGEVKDVAGALSDEHTLARGLIVETEHETFGTIRNLASPVRFGSEALEYRRAPLLDEDADYVLGSVLGYDQSRRATLEAEGAFGPREEVAVEP